MALQTTSFGLDTSDAASNINAQVRRRGPGRPDGLVHLVTEAPLINSSHQNTVIDIVCHIIWLNSVGLKTLQDGWFGFPQVISRLHEGYKKLLSDEEVRFADYLGDLYEPRMGTMIMDHVKGLTLEDTTAFINDDRPSQFYGEILRILVTRYQASIRAVAAADRHPDMDIPERYDWCKTKHDYLGQLSVNLEDCRHQLGAALRIIQELPGLIKRGADSSCLTGDHLKRLKTKMEALQAAYPTACSVLYGSPQLKWKLLTKTSEKWWEVDEAPEHSSVEAITTATTAYYDERVMQSSFNFIVPIVLLLSIIPAALAWTHGNAEQGSLADSDFYQAIAGSMLQVLGIATFIWPTLSHPRLSLLSWFWLWTAAGFSVICALLSIPLYLYLPSPAWSFTIAFSGAVVQAVVQLQVVNSI